MSGIIRVYQKVFLEMYWEVDQEEYYEIHWDVSLEVDQEVDQVALDSGRDWNQNQAKWSSLNLNYVILFLGFNVEFNVSALRFCS